MIDILAIKRDKREFLVIELKRDRSQDEVLGQIQRYMGYVKEKLAKDDQAVFGAIITHKSDIRLQRALSVTNSIKCYTYSMSFNLEQKYP